MAKNEANFKSSIAYCSKELTAVERIRLKDTADAIAINEALEENPTLIIEADCYAVLDIHNEKSENKDYKVYLIVSKDGTKYATSSESFYKSFSDIADELTDAGEDLSSVKIKCLLKPSKNYKGKSFITCTLA